MVFHFEEEDKDFRGIYPQLGIPWEKSKDQYWSEIDKQIGADDVKTRKLKTFWLSAAAIFIRMMRAVIYSVKPYSLVFQ